MKAQKFVVEDHQTIVGVIEGKTFLQTVDGAAKTRLAILGLTEDIEHVDQQAGQDENVADFFQQMRDIKFVIEQDTRKGHEQGLAGKADDQGQHQPVFEGVKPPPAFFEISDQGYQEKQRRGKFLGPVKNKIRVVSGRQGHEGEEREAGQGKKAGENINGLL